MSERMPIYLLLAALAVLFGCDGGPGVPAEWPPRHPSGDPMTASIPAGAALSHEIDLRKPLRWSGNMNLLGRRFVPVPTRFEVEGGVLVSRLGNIMKRATFGGWAEVRKSADDPEPIGWGPCLTDGEVILSNLFLAPAPEGIFVENRFEAADFGPDHTLIRIRPEEGDRLVIWFREPLGDSAFFGQMGQEGSSTLHGPFQDPTIKADYKVFRLGKGEGGTVKLDEPNTDPVLTFTCTAPGTTVTVGEWELRRRTDGWYSGDSRLGPK